MFANSSDHMQLTMGAFVNIKGIGGSLNFLTEAHDFMSAGSKKPLNFAP